MKFFNILQNLQKFQHHKSQIAFDSISGYDDIKAIIRRALDSEDPQNLLLCGPPASSKTQFLMEIMNFVKSKNCVYFDASNSTNRILQVLQEEKPDVVLLDELDKLPSKFGEQLLGWLESGRVKVDQKNCQMDFELKCKVFATANDVKRISKPLQSRFMKFFLSKYTEEQFLNVSEKVLTKLSPSIARYVGKQIFDIGGDVRNVIAVGKLVRQNDGPNEISEIISTVFKYRQEEEK
ncbi:MAG: ATP-binding protein [Candidatus Nitrosopolaris sp.]